MVFLIIVLLLIIAGISKSIMDVVNFHYKTSIFSEMKKGFWWNPSESWKNKYKDRDPSKGPAFFGSTTFFVFVTDSWHFFQMLMYLSLFGVSTIALSICISLSWYWFILIFFVMKSIFTFTFEMFWKKIWTKK